MKKGNECSFTKEVWFSEAILENMQESLIVTDTTLRIVYVNSATEKLFGYTKKEMIGQMPAFINAESNADEIQKNILETISSCKEWKGRILNRKKNGDLFTVELTICSLKDPEENLIGFIGYQKDMTETIKEKEKYLSIFKSSPRLITLVYADGTLKDCNDRIFDFLGYTKEEVVGKNIRMFFAGNSIEIVKKSISSLMSGSVLIEKEYEMIRKDGVVIDVNIKSTVAVDEDSKKHTICFIADITEQKKTHIELQHRNQELEQFAYAASHDLQEPLRVVSNYCEMLRDKCKICSSHDDETEKWMIYINDATGRMQCLIKELLDYSRVGRKDKPLEICSIKEIIDEATSDFEILIKESNATIIAEDNMPEVSCIKFRIRQLFHNLLSNAIKFRGKKDPVINISVCEEAEHYLFCVKDNGLGISPKYFDRIFGIFKRLYSREEYPGTGIGLALCKKIVETHNGKIWVDSEENKGAAFYFTLAKNIENI